MTDYKEIIGKASPDNLFSAGNHNAVHLIDGKYIVRMSHRGSIHNHKKEDMAKQSSDAWRKAGIPTPEFYHVEKLEGNRTASVQEYVKGRPMYVKAFIRDEFGENPEDENSPISARMIGQSRGAIHDATILHNIETAEILASKDQDFYSELFSILDKCLRIGRSPDTNRIANFLLTENGGTVLIDPSSEFDYYWRLGTDPKYMEQHSLEYTHGNQEWRTREALEKMLFICLSGFAYNHEIYKIGCGELKMEDETALKNAAHTQLILNKIARCAQEKGLLTVHDKGWTHTYNGDFLEILKSFSPLLDNPAMGVTMSSALKRDLTDDWLAASGDGFAFRNDDWETKVPSDGKTFVNEWLSSKDEQCINLLQSLKSLSEGIQSPLMSESEIEN